MITALAILVVYLSCGVAFMRYVEHKTGRSFDSLALVVAMAMWLPLLLSALGEFYCAKLQRAQG